MIEPTCVHCDATSFVHEFTLMTTDNFSVVCDAFSIVEGHILIIPKAHISCVGAFSKELFKEFMQIYDQCSLFIKKHME
jgi:diadenosine tetraphosphate (Ap4A) HIT family hydrolase